MLSLKKIKQEGFTIVELLIVIVVIGILAALVLNTFANVQKRARDTERATDIKAISTQLEACYNGSATSGTYCTGGGYPSTAFDWSTAGTSLKGIDENALKSPEGTLIANATAASTSDGGAGLTPTPTKDQYVYEARSGSTLCTSGAACDNFRLWYAKEDGGTVIVKKSLNQP